MVAKFVFVGGGIPDLPAIPCPEDGCGGMMRLQHKPAHYARNHTHPWWYRCQQPRCPGNVWAHPNGQPIATPVNRACRMLRKQAHEALDALWRVRGTDMKTRHRERGIVYLYIAHELDMDPQKVHLGRITDLETLRMVALVATMATRAKVLKWWERKGSKLWKPEDGHTTYGAIDAL